MKERIKRLWKKCWFKFISISFLIVLLLGVFHNPILRGIGSFLEAGDPLSQTEACFVLGGNSYERGMEAVNVYHQLPATHFYPTGANYPLQIQALDINMTEAELTSTLLRKKGVPDSLVHPMVIGTSTMEESDGILAFCKEKGIRNITVISSALHLRRVRWVFEEKFNDAGIAVNFHGSNAADFNSNNWWKSEEGLILGQNELVKLVYYFLKY